MDPNTRFTEEEVRNILARAADRQEQQDRAGDGATHELSLARLQEVAADVGISPAHLEAAAREVMLQRESPGPAPILGLPRELRSERIVPGQPSDGQWERMVSSFREIFGTTGIPSQFGAVREWVSSANTDESMPVVVRLEPVEGGTRIQVRQSVTTLSALTWGAGGVVSLCGLILGIMQAMNVLQAGPFTLVILIVGLLLVVGGWTVGRTWASYQQRTIERAADRAELVLRSGTSELNPGSTLSQLPAPPALP